MNIRNFLAMGLGILVLNGCGPGAAADRAWEAGEFEASIALYRDAGELELSRRLRLARALAGTEQLDAALVELEAVPQEAWTPDGWMAWGLVLIASGDPTAAAQAFATGVELGGDAALRVNHCGSLLAAGTPDASVCSEALVAAPQDPAAMLGLAASAMAEDNPVVVERSLDSLLAAPGSTPQQIEEAGRLFFTSGKLARACQAFQQAGGGGVEGGQACAAAGRDDLAQAVLEPLAETDSQAAFMLGTFALERALDAGSQALRQRAIADARRRFRACEQAFEGQASWHNNLGRLHALDGEEQPAELAFRRAMALDPNDPFPALNLSRLLEARGERVESGRLLEHVAGLGGITAAIAGLDLARRARAEGAEARAVELARGVLAGCHGDQATSCIVESCIVLSTMLAATEPEQAVALLERAAEIGGAGVADRLRAEPDLELLAEHERYAALVGQQP